MGLIYSSCKALLTIRIRMNGPRLSVCLSQGSKHKLVLCYGMENLKLSVMPYTYVLYIITSPVPYYYYPFLQWDLRFPNLYRIVSGVLLKSSSNH